MTFIKLGEINTLKEAFDADILVKSTWREPLLDKEKVISFSMDIFVPDCLSFAFIRDYFAFVS